MKILLVYPEFPDTFWSFKHALKFVQKKAGAPPLGLLTVAAMLPSSWEKRLVDLNVTSLTDKDLAWADYVFVSAMIVQRASAQNIIKLCKAAGVKIVAGGPLFTMEHEQFPDVDHFVLNEAEETLRPFLLDQANGQARRVYSSDIFPDIHQTPVPLWELANLKHYDTISIQFSRGCPFNCDFCNITTLLGHRPRTKTAAQIIAELDSIYSLGWRKSIFFVDDNFIGNKKHIKTEVLPALIEWRKRKTGMPFSTEASINLADDPELMRLMTQAGFDTVFVGYSSPVALHVSTWYPRGGTRPLLAALFLDLVQASPLVPIGDYICNLRLPFPTGDGVACCLMPHKRELANASMITAKPYTIPTVVCHLLTELTRNTFVQSFNSSTRITLSST